MFDGNTYDPKYDKERLASQLNRVFNCMKDRKWRTLKEISRIVSAPEASVSARLRDFRKERFGSYVVEMRPKEDRKKGWYEYRLLT